MDTKVLLIKKGHINSTGATLPMIEDNLKTTFKSLDYMEGFLDGYLFDNYSLLSLSEYEKNINNFNNEDLRNKYYIKFVYIEVIYNYDGD